MKVWVFLLLILSILSYGGCPQEKGDIIVKEVSPKTVINASGSVIPVKSPSAASQIFHYQLQTADYDLLKPLNFSFLVVDPDDTLLTAAQISDLRADGKVVLSYLSIGEAENYRDYWQSGWGVGNPRFIDEENPDWEGNFKVKYWDPEWQAVTLKRAREMADLGYSGVYLDIIDAYYYYQEKGRESAAKEMVEFVRAIKQSGQEINPDFMVFPQNSPELYDYLDYAKAIDGLGKESTWYVEDELQDKEETDYVLSFLRKAKSDGKAILAIDYPTDPEIICDFYGKCLAEGFYCTVSNRELDLDKPIACSNLSG